MTVEADDPAFRALTEKISRARGVRCEAYKTKCLRRRVAVRMRARGVHTFEAYSDVLDTDAAEYDRLLDALTINVTKFWRNAETWAALADPYLARLWAARHGAIRVWSAGCASGEEPYTIAVLLAEAARAAREAALLERARVDATDVDAESLARTAAAEYPDAAFIEMPVEPWRGTTFRVPPRAVPCLRSARSCGCRGTISRTNRRRRRPTISSCAGTS